MMMGRLAVATSVVVLGLLGTVEAKAAQNVLRVDLVKLGNFSNASSEKVKQAADVMERVLNSEEFHQAVLDFTYDGQKQFANNTDSDGNILSNEQVYAKIMAARETYSNTDDNVAQLNLNIYSPPFYKKWSVVGYGYPGQPEIFMNANYFHQFTIQEVAGNISHEWMHKIGFEHDFNKTDKRPFSVPYAVGSLVIKLSSAFLN